MLHMRAVLMISGYKCSLARSKILWEHSGLGFTPGGRVVEKQPGPTNATPPPPSKTEARTVQGPSMAAIGVFQARRLSIPTAGFMRTKGCLDFDLKHAYLAGPRFHESPGTWLRTRGDCRDVKVCLHSCLHSDHQCLLLTSGMMIFIIDSWLAFLRALRIFVP